MRSCRKTYSVVCLGAALFCARAVFGQTTPDYAVQLSTTVRTNPAQVTLLWPADSHATNYTVYRKSRDATVWGRVTSLPGTAVGYIDLNVSEGGTYEYRVDKGASISGPAIIRGGSLY